MLKGSDMRDEELFVYIVYCLVLALGRYPVSIHRGAQWGEGLALAILYTRMEFIYLLLNSQSSVSSLLTSACASLGPRSRFKPRQYPCEFDNSTKLHTSYLPQRCCFH